MKISELLRKGFVCLDLTAGSKEDALHKVIEMARGHPHLGDFPSFRHDIYEREANGGTSLGFGVVIPHARTDQVKDMLLVVARLTEGILFEPHDEIPVRLIFLIGTPKRMVTEYLRLIGTLVRHLKTDGLRSKLLGATCVEDLIRAFRESENA